MTYAKFDYTFALCLLAFDLALYLLLFIVVQLKGWWNLKKTLNRQLSDYPKKIHSLMIEKFRDF